jgi:hypothetical protein
MEEEEKKSFTVVDKRRFSEDGERISSGVDEATTASSAEARPEPSKETVAAEPRNDESASQTATSSNPGGGEEDPEIKVDFPSFIVSLYTQTMIMLGEIPHPETNLLNTNLDAARQTIEVIAMLEERTAGNRSPEEDTLMKDVLSSLRMGYVKKAKG